MCKDLNIYRFLSNILKGEHIYVINYAETIQANKTATVQSHYKYISRKVFILFHT